MVLSAGGSTYYLLPATCYLLLATYFETEVGIVFLPAPCALRMVQVRHLLLPRGVLCCVVLYGGGVLWCVVKWCVVVVWCGMGPTRTRLGHQSHSTYALLQSQIGRVGIWHPYHHHAATEPI
jgi:hypothetical protein